MTLLFVHQCLSINVVGLRGLSFKIHLFMAKLSLLAVLMPHLNSSYYLGQIYNNVWKINDNQIKQHPTNMVGETTLSIPTAPIIEMYSSLYAAQNYSDA